MRTRKWSDSPKANWALNDRVWLHHRYPDSKLSALFIILCYLFIGMFRGRVELWVSKGLMRVMKESGVLKSSGLFHSYVQSVFLGEDTASLKSVFSCSVQWGKCEMWCVKAKSGVRASVRSWMCWSQEEWQASGHPVVLRLRESGKGGACREYVRVSGKAASWASCSLPSQLSGSDSMNDSVWMM